MVCLSLTVSTEGKNSCATSSVASWSAQLFPLAKEKTDSISRIVQLHSLSWTLRWHLSNVLLSFLLLLSALTPYPSGQGEGGGLMDGGFVFKREWAWIGYSSPKPSLLNRRISATDHEAWYTSAKRESSFSDSFVQVVALRDRLSRFTITNPPVLQAIPKTKHSHLPSGSYGGY